MIILCDMIDGKENQSKFRLIYEKYKSMMYAVAYDISKNMHDAEDIVEISLIKIIEILDKINAEDIEKPRGKNLIITVTKNSAIDYGRKSENKIIPYESLEEYYENQSAEDLYIDTENYRDLILLINELDDKYKDVLRLKILYDFSSKEIGKTLDITEQNVNVRFMRAKAILKKRLEERKRDER